MSGLSRPVRVASWNLQSCMRGLGRVADDLRAMEADIVALQEVDRGTRRAGRVDQVAWLAHNAGYCAHAFFPSMSWDNAGMYGLGLLVRRDRLVETSTFALPGATGTEPRVLGLAKIETESGPLRVGVTHLSHRPYERALRVEQVGRIDEILAGEDSPVVLMGDFNDLPGTATHKRATRRLRDLFDAAGEGDPGTHPFAPGIVLRIDYVLGCARIRPDRVRVVRSQASDHHPIVADVRLVEAAAHQVV